MTDARRQTLAALRPYIERATSFSGWSHDQLAVRHLEAGPPWDYEALARDAVSAAERVLDLGTGGGAKCCRVSSPGAARGASRRRSGS